MNPTAVEYFALQSCRADGNRSDQAGPPVRAIHAKNTRLVAGHESGTEPVLVRAALHPAISASSGRAETGGAFCTFFR